MQQNQNEALGFRVRTDERTFKTIADQILHMNVQNDSQRLQRAALINSAKSYIDNQITLTHNGYRPLEYYMNLEEVLTGRARVKTIKDWINFNLDVFEKKSSGRLFS